MRTGRIVLGTFFWFGCALLTLAQSTNQPPAAPGDANLKKAGIKPIGDWQVDPIETQELDQIYAAAAQAVNKVPIGPDSGAQQRAVDNALREELESFLRDHPSSSYAPALHNSLAQSAELRCGYSLAMEHFQRAVDMLSGSADPTAQWMEMHAGAGLARLLALTGKLVEFDSLEAHLAGQGLSYKGGTEWNAARELRRWVRQHPSESYKCGLYCLDQLGRITQPGQFFPGDITETLSSTNGFTASDLLGVAGRVGLRIHAAFFTDTNNIPVPSILHLRSEHFVVIRGRRGAFYEVKDPSSVAVRWLTAPDIVEEATGCVLVSDAAPLAAQSALVSIDSATAQIYRGRCHGATVNDHNDGGPCTAPNPCDCAPGRPPPPPPPNKLPDWTPGGNPGGPGGGGGGGSGGGVLPKTSSCPTCGGMPTYFVSDPYLNVWLLDTPLSYEPAYGPPIDVRLAYHDRSWVGLVGGIYYWHGAQFGNNAGFEGQWSCSLLSFAELDSSGYTVDLMLPGSGWAIFNFTNNSTVSSVNFQHNLWLEKLGSGAGSSASAVTGMVLHYPDGSQITYGVKDTSDTSFAGVFYMTARSDPTGASTSFSYDSNFYLSTATAVDGTVFTLHFDNVNHPSAITSVTTSYGKSISFTYDDLYGPILRSITDAAGITSQITYEDEAGKMVRQLVTPYGTTYISTLGNAGSYGVFQRTVNITNTVGTIEFYGQIDSYTALDWTNFASAQIPTNTPVGTLDKDSDKRQERNTFYWNAQQFAPYVGTDLGSFNWPIFLRGRIRHWLASTEPTYTHWDSLSIEQAASPDGSTIGQLTWYDYAGKPAGINYESGVQIQPSVVARVMPDGSTWYQYFQRLTNGLPTKEIEAWIEGGGVHVRSNVFVYAANNVDLVSWTNALGARISGNAYNAYHQVVTNYDALGQVTTNGYDGTTHQITSSADPLGLVTLYTYDGSHRLQKAVDLPINRTNSFTWNSDGTVSTHTDPRNLVETYFWDGLHRLTGTADSRGSTTNLYYLLSGVPYPNSSGGTAILDLTATRDRLGHWTSYLYDALRREKAETNANGVVTAYSYCDCGAVSSVTNAWNTPVQAVTTFTLDNQGRQIMAQYADNYNVTNWFDSLGRVIALGDGAANRWLYYNNLGLLTVRSNAYGAELTQSYDLLDRPVYTTDANGVMTTNTYDNLSRVLTRGYPDGGVEKFGYSAKGMIAYTNQIGMTNFYAYDELGRRRYETNANAEILKYTNNAAGDLLSLTDGKNQITKWNYDQYGRVTNKVDQAGAEVLRYFYDAENRLTNRWSAAKGTTYYTNDAVGNLTYIKYPSSTSVSLKYDWLNRLTNMTDAVGTTKYTYTAGNQLLAEIAPFSSCNVTNTYTNRVRIALSLQQPTGLWTNKFAYDLAGRMINVTSPAGVFSYTRGGASSASTLVKKLLLPNTSYITNKFDSVARLTGTYLDNSANTVLDSAIYGYNKANQRTAFTNAAGTYVLYYYDNVGQLKVATSSVSTENRGYSYDAAWNMSWLTNTSAHAYTVDNKNELTGWTFGPGTYDGNGNRITANSGTGATSYTYDDENRLVSIVQGTIFRTDFVYDGLGRLRKRIEYNWNGVSWSPNPTINYIYDGLRVIQERDGNNGANDPLVSYTRGTDLSGTMEGAGGIGGLLARSSGYAGGNWSTHYFYHADGNGNITYLVDSSQAMAATYRYDPFGNTISSSGTLAAANVYRFSSKEAHIKSGMYIYLYRFYDPLSERWLNRDPISEMGGINLYAFVFNNPNGFVDGLGLDTAGDIESCKFKIKTLADEIKKLNSQRPLGPAQQKTMDNLLKQINNQMQKEQDLTYPDGFPKTGPGDPNPPRDPSFWQRAGQALSLLGSALVGMAESLGGMFLGPSQVPYTPGGGST